MFETKVSKKLNELGIKTNLRGYRYLRYAICLSEKDKDYLTYMTKKTYPAVAREFNTTERKAEGCMRFAVSKTGTKMTNSEFIQFMLESVKNEMVKL